MALSACPKGEVATDLLEGDEEAATRTAMTYRDIFGGSPAPMWRLHVAKSVWSGAGSLEIGIRTGFWSKAGHAILGR